MLSVKNKVVVITGGSRGIGEACVKIFAGNGARVWFTYKNGKDQAKKLIASLSEYSVKALRMDMASEKSIIKGITAITAAEGRIDILVNNAGIWTYGAADTMPLQVFTETMSINMTSSFLVTREVLPGMKKRKSGKIIYISSTAGQRGEALHSHYAASKGAQISFTKSLAAEAGPWGINVNCIAPGWVDTDMSASALRHKRSRQEIESAIPIRRVATAEDIAWPVFFLATEAARHINGEILNVNGGSVLCG